MTIFYTCQTGGHIVDENPLNYDFSTHQCQLCNINFPVISTQNGCGTRIIIDGPKCTFSISDLTSHKIEYKKKAQLFEARQEIQIQH